MSIKQIEKRQLQIHERMQALQEEARELEKQKQEELDATNLRIIRKNKISPEQLMMLNKFSEEELMAMLREKEEKNHHEIAV